MGLSLGAVMALAQQCAPGIALEAIVSQVSVESGFNELAIGINKGPRVHARSPDEAAAIATRYIQAGYSVDLGLTQINSHNLSRLKLSVRDAFNPCLSLQAAARLLSENYKAASASYTGIDAIGVTWSLYNSGSTTRGFRNGYVGKVWRHANALIPQMRAVLADMPVSSAPGSMVIEQPITGSTSVTMTITGHGRSKEAEAREVVPLPSSVVNPFQTRWFYGVSNDNVIVFKSK